MNVQDTVEELTQVCIEIRENLESLVDKKERKNLILNHIEEFTKRGSRITDFQKGYSL